MGETVAAMQERMTREMVEAAFVLTGMRELQRFRGRLSKVTVNDVVAVLGAARNLTTEALLAVAEEESSNAK